MRTSGVATESRMTLAIFLVALGIAIVLAGGPRDFMVACDNALRAVAESIYQGWLSFRA